VRREAWQVVGEATNAYDAASAVEQYLRSLKYSTRVPVPPADRDWVSFLLFESKEGYCDYYATAMTVMLRAIGIPARVASGYVTGDWDPATQSYLISERHAHTWTEVYFPGYGWITFEPSANRPGLVRPERPLVAMTEEEIQRVLEASEGLDDFLEEEEELDGGTFVPLPADRGPAFSPALILVLFFSLALVVGIVGVTVAWFRGIPGLPLFARGYARIVRLASWCGLAPQRGHTPYEFTRHLAGTVPGAAEPLGVIADAYVAGTYGRRSPDGNLQQRLRAAGAEAQRVLFGSLAAARLKAWFTSRLRAVTEADRRR
jgi:hypothetical protein